MTTFNDLLMPKLGLTMTEGMLMEWNVSPGDRVVMGATLFVVETDKVATEIDALADGVMGDILVQAGETVPVGAIVARWTGPGQSLEAPTDVDPVGGATNSGDTTAATISETDASSAQYGTEQQAEQSEAGGASSRVVATPLARRHAHAVALDLATVKGTGPKGRIKASDVRAVQAQHHEGVNMQDRPATGQSRVVSGMQQVPPSALVHSMAARMVQAKQVPHFYLALEAEVSELLVLRRRLNQYPASQKLTLNHFVVAAVARALALHPHQNRIWKDDGILQLNSADVGIAVSTERGLMAPVLHGLDGATLDELAQQADALVERIRSGKAVRADLEGGAISVSNAGMYNVTYMTPIINPPQSAILGVGSIRDVFRPDAHGDPTLRHEMGLVLAADHRLHDGASALQFLNCVVDLLQEPYGLLRHPGINKG